MSITWINSKFRAASELYFLITPKIFFSKTIKDGHIMYKQHSCVATTIEIIISIVVENEFETKLHIATTIEITTTIEIIISIVVENEFQT